MNIRNTLFLAMLLALPMVVALFDVSFLTVLAIVLGIVVWRWVSRLRALAGGPKDPPLVLETIGASHFAEKVRWSLDRLGVPYRERICAGTLGAFHWGRTVPVLEFRTGSAWSSIGNSPEILRYLWGRYGDSHDGGFLEPTAERVELESRLDRYGRNLQVWLYWLLLDEKNVILKAWGAWDPEVPAWQRLLIRVLYPVQARLIRRAFRLTPTHFAAASGHIETLLADIDAAVTEHPASILGGEGDEPNYTDYAFAALSSLWVLPANFANRGAVLELGELPDAARADIERFRTTYPAAYAFASRLYGGRGGEHDD